MAEKGPLPARRFRLNPKLREAVRDAMVNRLSSWTIGSCAGFTHPSVFSTQLHAESIAATPLNIARWQRVAATIGFTDSIFEAEEEAAEVVS
jgi:hypothetical protein